MAEALLAAGKCLGMEHEDRRHAKNRNWEYQDVLRCLGCIAFTVLCW